VGADGGERSALVVDGADERLGRAAVQQDHVRLADRFPRVVERGLRLLVQPLRPLRRGRPGVDCQVRLADADKRDRRPWDLDPYSVAAGLLALAGGGLAIFELQVRKRFAGRAVATWACLYASFVVYVAATA
jgi:hypothetical protein